MRHSRQKGRFRARHQRRKLKGGNYRGLRSTRKTMMLKLRDKRNGSHKHHAEPEAKLEDFLSHQAENRRRNRLRMVDPTRRTAAEADRMQCGISYKLQASEENNAHFDWLHNLQEYYDSRGIGDADLTQGRADRLDNATARGNPPSPPRLGPRNLHLWTLRLRYAPSGLSSRNDTHDEDKSLAGFDDDERRDCTELRPMPFTLNLEAIEAWRVEAEMRRRGIDGEDHITRRLRQQEEAQGGRPNTANTCM